jgi:hypothetical protein
LRAAKLYRKISLNILCYEQLANRSSQVPADVFYQFNKGVVLQECDGNENSIYNSEAVGILKIFHSRPTTIINLNTLVNLPQVFIGELKLFPFIFEK